MSQSVTIIGYGFVSQLYIKKYHNQFNEIITTTRSSNYTNYSTKSLNFDLYSPKKLIFPITDYCIITLPFSRSLTNPFSYSDGIKALIEQLPIESYKKVIFTSSTSVYPVKNSYVNELSELDSTTRSKALKKAEDVILSSNKHSFVLRLSGICGHTRTSSQKLHQPIIKNSNLPVNLIHVDDIIDTMNHLLIEKTVKQSDIINLTSSEHPTREEYYTYLCRLFKLPVPTFEKSNEPFKKVSNQLLTETYNIELTHQSPLTFTFSNDT